MKYNSKLYFAKEYEHLKNNSKLIHKTSRDEFEIYLTDSVLLTIIDLRGQDIWSLDKNKNPTKWKRIIRIFERFGIIIE